MIALWSSSKSNSPTVALGSDPGSVSVGRSCPPSTKAVCNIGADCGIYVSQMKVSLAATNIHSITVSMKEGVQLVAEPLCDHSFY